MSFDMGTVQFQTEEGSVELISLSIHSPQGITIAFLDADAAIQVGVALRNQGKQSKSGLTRVNPTIIMPDGHAHIVGQQEEPEGEDG